MADTSIIATAADYADAMLVARRAKKWLFLLLLLMLLVQITMFVLYRADVIKLTPQAPAVARAIATAPTTIPAAPSTQNKVELLLIYLIGLTDFLGIILAVVLALILLLIINIMLVGRLIGVSRMTSAFCWALLLIVLLFPWQAFLGDFAFKIPGVLYTWNELVSGGRWQDISLPEMVLKWARFVGFPVLAVVILCMVQVKSRRGIRQALGEDVAGV